MSARLAAALLLLPLLGACATKRDVRDLRDEMQSMRAAQDSALREMQRENRQMLDSIAAMEQRTRGDVANRFLQVDRQLVQIQELTGQGQQRLAEMREQLDLRQRQEAQRQAADSAARTRAASDTSSSGSGAGPSAGDVPAAGELFESSLRSLRRGSFQTARAGFQEFLRAYPQHRQAADAQFYVGETHNEAKEVAPALQAYARVVQLYPTSARAPTALYRAGTIESGRGNRTEARALFERITRAYPQSPEAPLAREQVQRLNRAAAPR
ncbi:MAG TPA: tol-pal system protein YbgF [Longimicrobiaceae bacterium]